MASVGEMEEEDSHLMDVENAALLSKSSGLDSGDAQSSAPSPKQYHSHTSRELTDHDKTLLQVRMTSELMTQKSPGNCNVNF